MITSFAKDICVISILKIVINTLILRTYSAYSIDFSRGATKILKTDAKLGRISYSNSLTKQEKTKEHEHV